MKGMRWPVSSICIVALGSVFHQHDAGWGATNQIECDGLARGQNLPLFVAQEEGFFLKRGLSVDLINALNSDELPKGLVDGR